MKVTARINLLDATKEGISKSTGNPWKKKEVVLEVTNEDGKTDTIAASTMNRECIEVLEKCMEGDVVEVVLGMQSRAREYNNMTYRSTEVFLREVRVKKEATF